MKKNKEHTRKQNTIYFIIILICSTFAGGILGFASNFWGQSWKEMLMSARDAVVYYSPYMLFVLEILVFTLSLLYYFKAKKMAAVWEAEDEEIFEKIERTEGIALSITCVGVILNMVIYGFVIANFNSNMKERITLYLIASIVFTVSIIGLTFLQRVIIDQIKKIRPEKRGDALELNFQKKWIESCDEQELQQVYRAAYKAYSSTTILYTILLVVLLLGELFFNIGITPILVLGIIWLTQTIIYQRESLKK
ncbi:MAG: DUF3169 family protein [Lachnospiraceae bacterium]|nr:DUF3169 family protein [Lachnospiraceae bacterium]MDD3617526.1 DUF3169 family protein [Lachnospiraceae bacterium]